MVREPREKAGVQLFGISTPWWQSQNDTFSPFAELPQIHLLGMCYLTSSQIQSQATHERQEGGGVAGVTDSAVDRTGTTDW